MKLRLLPTASKDTLKIEVPSNCALPQLKHLIAERIRTVASSYSASGSSSGSSTITVSLIRKDGIIGSPEEPLQYLDVSSGDLLFYSADSSVLLPQSRTLVSGSSQHVPSSDIGKIDCGSSGVLDDAKTREVEGSGDVNEEMADVKENETIELKQSGVAVKDEIMGVDLLLNADGKRQSMPNFLKNVLKESKGVVLSGYSLLVVAVQAVLVDSGFVRLDSETGAPVYEFHIPKADAPTAMTLMLRYTLRELIESESISPEFVTVKMYKHGCDLSVYGALSGNNNGCYFLRLDDEHFGRNMELELQKSNEAGEDSEGAAGVSLSERHDSAVFRFSKEVKDKLALPLLVEICDKAGLQQPPCLMRIPTELKLKIFELVSGADLAKLACQCTDLQYLTSDNALWKIKYAEEFGNAVGDESTNWKQKFVLSWKTIKEMKNREGRYRFDTLVQFHRPLRNDRPPPFRTPFIIVRNYGLYSFGDAGPYVSPFGDAGPYVSPFGGLSNRQPSFPYPSFQPSRRLTPNHML